MLSDKDIRHVFNQCFAEQYKVRLTGNGAEPLYTPATEGQTGLLVYREDFAASALHEAAHWCIASEARRRHVDFGYEYLPPPRSAEQQAAFFQLELKVQSLESLFAQAAGIPFQVSADNLQAEVTEFAQRVESHAGETGIWLHTEAGQRAALFLKSL